MWKWLRKLFMTNEQTAQTTVAPKKKFEIQLFDEVINDKTGQMQYQRVSYDQPIIIEAANKRDLDEHAARFKLCNQVMKIIREIPTSAPPQAKQPVENAEKHTSQPTTNQDIPPPPPPQYAAPVKKPPKYYSISGIDIKDDNGKIYQKQWMRLSDKDAENFRIVSDSNNKIVQLTGKHIEMKRWVLVENTELTENNLESEFVDE